MIAGCLGQSCGITPPFAEPDEEELVADYEPQSPDADAATEHALFNDPLDLDAMHKERAILSARTIEGTTMAAAATRQQVSIDGVISTDEWDQAAIYFMDGADKAAPGIVVEGSKAGLADTSATIYVQHDADYLYLAVIVSDDTVVSRAGYVWEADCVELFLDHDNSDTNKTGLKRYQFDVSANGDTIATSIVPDNSWDAAASARAGGYAVEYRLSKSALGLATGQAYGFDIAVSDVEPYAGAIQTRYWLFSNIEASTDETRWGDLYLEEVTNTAPEVDAGADKGGAATEQINLNGWVSDDGFPGPLSVAWSKLSGPGTVSFADASAASTSATFSEDGVYELLLSADDGELSGSDTMRVNVGQDEVTDGLQVVHCGAAMVIDGVINTDEWGNSRKYSFDAGDNTAPGFVVEGAITSQEDSSATLYLKQDLDYLYFAVDVKDDKIVATADNVWDADCIELYLDHDNSRIASIGVNRVQFDIAAGGDTVDSWPVDSASWTGGAKIRADGYSVEYRISKADFNIGSTGSYGFDIAVIDVDKSAGMVDSYYWYFSGEAASTNETLWGQIVLDGVQNQAPLVSAGDDKYLIWPTDNVVLEGEARDDGMPNPPGALELNWRKVSGPGTVTFESPNAATTKATFSDPGEYVLELMADDSIENCVDTVLVSIEAVANQAPFINGGSDATVTWPTNSVRLDAWVMDDGNPDPPGAVTVAWTKESGPGDVQFDDSSALDAVATFSTAGIYELKITASDGALEAWDRVLVKVEAADNEPPQVSAGADKVVNWPTNTVTLTGTASDDGIPNANVAVTWTMVSGPAQATIAQPESLQTGITFAQTGSYEFKLTGDDGEMTASDTVRVSVVSGEGMAAPFATSPVTVDGTIGDSEWQLANVYVMDAQDALAPGAVVEGVTVGAADSSATIYLKHDAQYIYVGVAVKDDNVIGNADYVWDADSVELFLDHDQSETAYVGMNRMQFDVSANGDTIDTSIVPANSWTAAAARTSDGYSVEYKLNKSALGLALSGTYGFDIAISDVEPSVGTIDTRYWYFANYEASAEETAWGALTLEAAPLGDPLLAVGAETLDFGAADSLRELEVWNAGGESLTYSVTTQNNWLSISPTSGTCSGESSMLAVTVDRGALSMGVHEGRIVIDAGDAGSATVAVSLEVTAGTLAIAPTGALTTYGVEGGPFNPSSAEYTLANTGGTSINWTASKGQSWVSLSKSSGSLEPGATVKVTVSLNSGANALEPGTHNDLVTFTNSTNGNGNATRSVTLSVSAESDGNAVAMQTASRTSGIAPLSVFFDAIPAGNGVVQPSNGDHTSMYYTWDFGDAAAGTWATDGKSRNKAYGYMAAHVYETPGTYTARLTVLDANGQTHQYEQTITVAPFSGTTYYVSNSQGSDNNNGLSTTAPFKSYAKAMSMAGTNRRILFKRGDSWTIGAGVAVGSSGPGIIGAYGTGNQPVIRVTGNGPAFDMYGTDWRIMDLKLVGPGSSSNQAGIEGTRLTRNTFLRVNIESFRIGVTYGWVGALDHAENTIADSTFKYNHINNAYLGGKKIAVLGSRFEQAGISHLLRVWHMRGGVISNNVFHDPGGDRLALKFHNELELALPDSQYGVISDNDFRGHVYTVSIAPQWWGADERIKDVVFERNVLRALSDSQAGLIVVAQRVTVRNNVFNANGASLWYKGVEMSNNLAGGNAAHKVYNNTIYRSDSADEFIAIKVSGGDCVVRNNLACAPSCGYRVMVTGSPDVQDHNLLHDNPLFVNPAGDDFCVRDSSPAKNAGMALTCVRDSLNGLSRPLSGTCDLGAFQR